MVSKYIQYHLVDKLNTNNNISIALNRPIESWIRLKKNNKKGTSCILFLP